MQPYRVYKGDCLVGMPTLPAKSVNLILSDLPYGTTNCSWDAVIPFEPLWAEYRRLLAPGGCVVLFGSMPFSALLVASNLKWFSHHLVWDKNKCGSPGLAKYRPMKTHEDVFVFAPNGHTYNPQMTVGEPYSRKPPKQIRCNNHKYGFAGTKSEGIVNTGTRYPKSVQLSPRDFSAQQQLHPTQKPVPWLRWLIRTYSNPGEVVLDNAAGVLSTGVAAVLEDRPCILMEKDEDEKGNPLGYIDLGMPRLEGAIKERNT